MTDLKPGWQRVKFGEVVRLNKETCKDPEAAGINRVIGLEHLEPGDLRVRSWADVADGTTFSNRVRPGQVLFGKRRAYQRKVAVADFDAICSGDIYVFESADPKRLLPELLPFICQTEAFFEYAVGTSAGSLSPRTNWKSLASYEFALPPLEEQQTMIHVLHAAYRVKETLAYVLDSGMRLLASASWDLATGRGAPGHVDVMTAWQFGRPPLIKTIPASWQVTAITAVARLESGHTPSRKKLEYWGGDIPWISLGDVSDLNLRGKVGSKEMISKQGEEKSSARLLPAGTVVLSRTASVGRVATMGCSMATSQDYVNFVCGPDLRPDFLYFYFRALKPYWEFIAEGGGVRTIYYPFFKVLQVPVPPLPIQDEILKALSEIENSVTVSRSRLENAVQSFSFVCNNVLQGIP